MAFGLMGNMPSESELREAAHIDISGMHHELEHVAEVHGHDSREYKELEKKLKRSIEVIEFLNSHKKQN